MLLYYSVGSLWVIYVLCSVAAYIYDDHHHRRILFNFVEYFVVYSTFEIKWLEVLKFLIKKIKKTGL